MLKIIADNPQLMAELRTLLYSKFDGLTPHEAEKHDDKRLGELVRARLTGRKLVDDALRDIEQLKGDDPQPITNPAR